MSNIVLIGMPSCGKSSIGKLLAKKINYSFIDTDKIITEKFGKSLVSIIDEQGFDAFVKIEGDVGANLIANNSVIATGGSMALIDYAMENLKKIGFVVFLDAPLHILEPRLKSTMGTRGVATAKPMTAKELYEYRLPYYKHYADMSIKCYNNMKLVVNELSDILKEKNILD